MLSHRSAVEAQPSRLGAALDAARAGSVQVIDLTLSNPTQADLSYAAYGPNGATLAGEGPVYCPDPLGLLSARQAVAQSWQTAERPDPERILLLPSSSEAYHYLFTLLCDAGDDVLAPEPSYPLLLHLARYAGVRLQPYRLAYDGAWHIDMDALRRARGPRTRAIVLISPNNPTGSYTRREELSQLAELGLPLVSDEVFAPYELEPQGAALRSAFGATRALTFCIDGLSKSAGLPQLKLSWVAASGPEAEVAEAMQRLAWLADTYLSVATPVQVALPTLLARAPAFRAPLLSRLRNNLLALQTSLAGSAASVLRAEGGWYAVVRLPDLVSEEQWVLGLIERGRVLTHPGYFYDFSETGPHLVLSLLAPEDVWLRGVEAIRSEVDRRVHSG
jgi:aspartate/methionine/tyrosine aminotransferase